MSILNKDDLIAGGLSAANAATGITNRGVRTVIIGNSLTFASSDIDKTGGAQFVYDAPSGVGYYTPNGAARINTADYGAWTWADALMGAPHYLIKNSGIGGNTTAQVLARFAADCINLKPDLVYLWIGRNDFKNGKSFEYVRDNWLNMLGQLSAAGIFVCAIDVPPSADLSSVAGAATETAKFNGWLRDEARRRHGQMVMVSASAVMVDPDVANSGAAKSTFVLNDNTHNNNLGAMRVGEAIARVMGPIVRAWENYPVSPTEGWDYLNSAVPRIRSSNPLFSGTDGNAGAGVMGSVATGYDCNRTAGSPTVVASKVTDRDNIGMAQRLAITYAAADDGVDLGVRTTAFGGNIASRFVPGKLIEAQCDVAFSADTAAVINRMELVISGTFSGVGTSVSAMRRINTSLDQGLANNIQPLPLAGKVLRLRTPRVLLPAPCTLLQYFVRFYAAGAGTVTVDVSRFAVSQFDIG